MFPWFQITMDVDGEESNHDLITAGGPNQVYASVSNMYSHGNTPSLDTKPHKSNIWLDAVTLTLYSLSMLV